HRAVRRGGVVVVHEVGVADHDRMVARIAPAQEYRRVEVERLALDRVDLPSEADAHALQAGRGLFEVDAMASVERRRHGLSFSLWGEHGIQAPPGEKRAISSRSSSCSFGSSAWRRCWPSFEICSSLSKALTNWVW